MKGLVTLALLLSTFSTYCLYQGSKTVPWERQTIDGVSPWEKNFKAARVVWNRWGFLLLGTGFLIQLVALWIPGKR